MLRALAIVIAILIVLNAQDRKDQPPPTTVTETPTSLARHRRPPARPRPAFGDHEPDRYWVLRPVDNLSPLTTRHVSEQNLR
ncbi:hypothetical protein H7I42_22280 [Mycolicibacterium vanbaalenii PYR-1]|nr:hypothetical protein [Mycolicibacterium vanbaalenii PYR-1]